MYPKTFQKLINNFSQLPSIGPRLAERLVLHLFKQKKEIIDDFAKNLLALKNLKSCQRCYNLAETKYCEICNNNNRNQKIICVVEDPLDIIALEKTKKYQGLYHVLGGTIENEEKIKYLNVNQLIHRIKKEQTEELIIATNPTTEGDLTAFYLKEKLKSYPIKITRLARGLSTGGDIEYADEITLSSALINRQKIK